MTILEWTVVAIAIVLMLTMAAVIIYIAVIDRRRSDQQQKTESDCWSLEMWNIRYGYRISILFRNNMVLGRGSLYNCVVGGTVTEIDQTISREQCMLYEQDGILWIWNLSMVNPTMVNGYRLNAPRQLLPGDRIEMGYSAFLVTRAEYIR